MATDPAGRKEGRLRRHLRLAKEVRERPGRVLPLARDWLIGLWAARGGGFYGLGFVLTFVYLEASMLTGELGSSDNLAGFFAGELVEYLLRFGVQSFVNTLLALIWPLLLLERYELWGLATIVAGYFLFEHVLKPVVEAQAPELARVRERREEQRRAKRARKRNKGMRRRR